MKQNIPLPPTDLRIHTDPDGGIRIRIETPQLVITSVTPDDAGDYHAVLYNDPDVMKTYTRSGNLVPLEEVKSEIASAVKHQETGNPFTSMAIRLKDRTFVGEISLRKHHPVNPLLSYAIGKAYWDKGYTTEAVNAVVKYLAPVIRAYGLNPVGEIDASAMWDNTFSLHILRNSGFKRVPKTESLFTRDIEKPDRKSSWEIQVFPHGITRRERY